MNRSAYLEKLKAQLDEWNAELDKLEARGRQATAEAKIKYAEQLDYLRERRDAAERKLQELRAASDLAWDDLRQGAEESWSRLMDALAKARAQFK